jgi:hypothetical protein
MLLGCAWKKSLSLSLASVVVIVIFLFTLALRYLCRHLVSYIVRACSAGCKPTLLQLFGLLQLQSIERKIL